MTQTARRARQQPRPGPGGRLAGRLRGRPDRPRRRPRGRHVRADQLLARPGRVHLEHQDRREPRRRRRPARGPRWTRPTRPGFAHRPSRRTRPTASPRRGSSSRPRSGRGRGLLRLDADGKAPGRCSPRSTSSRATRSRKGTRRPKGAEHGANQRPGDLGRSSASGRRRELGLRRPSPTSSSSAAARAASRSAPGCASSACRRIVIDKHAPARRPVAQPLQVAVPARPGLVRPPALPQVPRQLAGVLAQGQDRRLARVLHEGDGAQLLVEHRGHERVVRRGDRRVDRRGRARRPAASTLRPKQLVLATGMSGKPNIPTLARHGRVPRRPAPLLRAPRPGRLRRQEGRRHRRRTTPPSTSAARCGRTAPT